MPVSFSTGDACSGDSGGPQFIKGANATTDFQVGVVSWVSFLTDVDSLHAIDAQF